MLLLHVAAGLTSKEIALETMSCLHLETMSGDLTAWRALEVLHFCNRER
jgi:hypothetical protein